MSTTRCTPIDRARARRPLTLAGPGAGLLVATVLLGAPTVPPAGAAVEVPLEGVAPISNGDGRLSAVEFAQIDAAPVASLDAADLADINETDLSRLPADVRELIETPVTVVESSHLSRRHGRSARATTQDSVGWHMDNALGWHLADYHLAASWSFDGTKVYDPSSWTWGNGHWGWQMCSEDARGEWWANTEHTVWNTSGRGKFGPIGCAGEFFTLGGVAAVSRNGNMWIV